MSATVIFGYDGSELAAFAILAVVAAGLVAIVLTWLLSRRMIMRKTLIFI